MPTFDLTGGVRTRSHRRRNLFLIVTPLVAGTLVLAVVTRGNGSAESGLLGPTVVAEPRDLATTLEASGTLRRSDQYTVAYAAALPSDGDGDGDGGDGGDGDVEPVSYLTGPDTSSSSSTTSSTTPTTEPCSPTSTSSTSTSSSSTTSTTPCPTTTSTTSTTTSTTSTTSTTEPTTSNTTPTTQPRSSGGDTSTAPSGDAGGRGDAGAPTADGGSAAPTGGSGGTGPSGGDGGSGGEGEMPSATLTSLLDVGATADRGTVLYTADQQPVVALIGDLPAWRTLEEGVDDGADVRQLEENLAALGYGEDIEVDETFTADTAAAVEAWETDLGRAAPDGTVTIGDVVFLTAPGDVLGHQATVGDILDAGTPVLTIGTEQRTVVADVDVTEAGGWTPGSTVELEWADGTTTEGTVIGTGRDVTDGQVELTVAVATGDAGAGARRSGAQATITLVDARRDGAIAVPIAAIVDHEGTPAVRVAQPDGPDRTIAVETGLVADGWIEITAGLDGGEEVRLPG